MMEAVKHIPEWKVREVEEIRKLLKEYPVVALAGVFRISAGQIQKLRRELRGLVFLKMSRNTLMARAFDGADEGYPKLKDYLSQQTILVFTHLNPFKLYKLLEASKVPAPIMPGMTAPKDIVIEAGKTPFPPGPIVGELQRVGIPAAIEGGKVVVRERTVVAKAGDVVGKELADILSKLEIYPMEVGLDLRVVYHDGVIFKPSELAIDSKEYEEKVAMAFSQAFSLAVNSTYTVRETMETILMKALSDALSLGVNAEFFEPEILTILVSQAHSSMLSIASCLKDDALDDELKRVIRTTETEERVEKEEVEEKEEKEEPEEKKEKEKEEEEESGIEGLGALFG
jgi:large subunit ribosomal protein L10